MITVSAPHSIEGIEHFIDHVFSINALHKFTGRLWQNFMVYWHNTTATQVAKHIISASAWVMTCWYSHTHIGEARHDAACYCCHIFVLLHFTTLYPIGIFRGIGLVLPPHLCVHQNPELHRTLHQTTKTRLSHSQTQTLLQGIVALRSLTAQSAVFSRKLGLHLPCF